MQRRRRGSLEHGMQSAISCRCRKGRSVRGAGELVRDPDRHALLLREVQVER
jgi:hypothetical protein